MQQLLLTKELFDKIPNGGIFRKVVTNLQTFHESFKTELLFICKKSDAGESWAVYAGHTYSTVIEIAAVGDKVYNEETIRSVCPCNDEVFALYRH